MEESNLFLLLEFISKVTSHYFPSEKYRTEK